MEKKFYFGFTLAEVLITLSIISIIAALTLPQLIANHKKQSTISQLQRFNSLMNQAIKASIAENGEMNEWGDKVTAFNSNELYQWYEKYFKKYIAINEVQKISDGILVSIKDGSAFGMYSAGIAKNSIHILYCTKYKYCKNLFDKHNNKVYGTPTDGKNTFFFFLNYEKGLIVPYGIGEKRNIVLNDTYYGCKNSNNKFYCSALIIMDGWVIRNDYPIKF